MAVEQATTQPTDVTDILAGVVFLAILYLLISPNSALSPAKIISELGTLYTNAIGAMKGTS